ncbi:hypothetical protein [Agathobaculum butyriciproducens]|uniref:hypothetical protein n=1 Tax=Agathobaculum butyriciproducens TaxID=1628085 RepID=UPI003AB3FC83
MKMIDLPFDKDLAKLTQLSEQLKQSKDAQECSRLADELLCKMESTTLSARCCLRDFLRPIKRAHLQHILPYPSAERCSVEVTRNGWTRIRLNTLLQSNRQYVTGYIESTLLQMLHEYRLGGGNLPWYERAFVVITEHTEKRRSDRTFDPDNKEWKCILNALKGVLFEDDNSQTVSLILDSMTDGKGFTEVAVVPYFEVQKSWIAR